MVRGWWWFPIWLLACAPVTPRALSAEQHAEQLSRSCLEGNRPTCMNAARHYASKSPSPVVSRRLAALYYRACLDGNSEACRLVADMFERADVAPPPRRHARAVFEHVCGTAFPVDPRACMAAALHGRACDDGMGRSCASLAELHGSGRLGTRRPWLTRQLHARACARGYTASCARVANEMVRSDPAGAAKLFAVGCQSDDTQQCLALADVLHRGAGVPRDLRRARELRRRACKLGEGGGCHALASMWRKGLGGLRDDAAAMKLYDRACAMGAASGCLALARAHAAGAFGEADMALSYELSGKAAKLSAAACEAGDMQACHRLGVLERGGTGVRENRAHGLALQQRACEAGHGPACIAWLTRGPHRVGLKGNAKMAHAVSAACRRGDGEACFAVAWIGVGELTAAGARPPVHALARGCRVGHAPSCNAHGIVHFPPSRAGLTALSDACELGYGPGCHHLGIAEELKTDVEADERAVVAYARACALHWPKACTRLGMMRRAGHVGPGAMSSRSAFQKACSGGDAGGCFEISQWSPNQTVSDGIAGMMLLASGCRRGHTPSCVEHAIRRLGSRPNERMEALMALRSACDVGGARACLVLVREFGPGDQAEREAVLELAVRGARATCDDGLAVCGGQGVSRTVSRRWTSYEQRPAWEIDGSPVCGIALERACVVVRDALVLRCELTGTRCFEAGREIRKLAAAGSSIGVADAIKVEQRGFAQAKRACRGNDARSCRELSVAYREGAGTAVNSRRAARYHERACRLDEALCSEP